MQKRFFDLFISSILLMVCLPLLIVIYLIVCFDTMSNGIFIQNRVGQYGKGFNIYKFKTMHPSTMRISRIGKILRKTKLDEFPQLWNVIKGDMSIVGPRPDIPGYYDTLIEEDRKILQLKPGITSLASLKYSNEEELLAVQADPLRYNDEIIFPDKVKMNLDYYYQQSLQLDIKILFETFKKLVKALI